MQKSFSVTTRIDGIPYLFDNEGNEVGPLTAEAGQENEYSTMVLPGGTYWLIVDGELLIEASRFDVDEFNVVTSKHSTLIAKGTEKPPADLPQRIRDKFWL